MFSLKGHALVPDCTRATPEGDGEGEEGEKEKEKGGGRVWVCTNCGVALRAGP